MSLQSGNANYIRRSKLIIIDECSMAPGLFLNELDRFLKTLMNNNLAFGGKIVLMSGDFQQTLPVSINATRTERVNSCIKHTDLFSLFEQHTLTRNMRLNTEDKDFDDYLQRIGSGMEPRFRGFPEDIIELRQEHILTPPERFEGQTQEQIRLAKIDKLIEHTFNHVNEQGEYLPFYNDIEDQYTARNILTPLNVSTFEINERIISDDNKIPGNHKHYFSIDSIEGMPDLQEDGQVAFQDFMHTQTPSGLPLHDLHLKEGVLCIMMRNKDVSQGFCNSTFVRIISLRPNMILIRHCQLGTQMFLSRSICSSTQEKSIISLKRLQFPIRIGYAATINKSQGGTMERVGLYLPEPVFDHGQFFVAISRTTSSKGLKILVENGREQGTLTTDPKRVFTKNVVFREVLINSETQPVIELDQDYNLIREFEQRIENDEQFRLAQMA